MFLNIQLRFFNLKRALFINLNTPIESLLNEEVFVLFSKFQELSENSYKFPKIFKKFYVSNFFVFELIFKGLNINVEVYK